MKNKKYFLLTGLLLIAFALSSCLVVESEPSRTDMSDLSMDDGSVPPAASTGDLDVEHVTDQKSLAEIYERVNPGVVSILVYTSEGGVGQGSGFVYDREGHIITNYHVIEDSVEIEVTFPSGTRTRAEVIGTDVDSDLAVINVSVDEAILTPLPLGNSSNLSVGDFVVAIGNPFGYSGTMTTGIVSARGRILDSIRSAGNGSVFAVGDLIQTDAAINPGNSGGPLLNLQGEVIGINRAIYADASSIFGGTASFSGIGFAIPIDIVKKVVPLLIEEGSYDYPYLGISSQDGLTMAEVEALGFDPSIPGVYVLGVASNGPADQAGIRTGTRTTEYQGLFAGGDLIIAVDGVRVRNFNELLTYLFMNKAPGDEMLVTVIRNGDERDIVVELGSRSE